jgi:hypothetical protein
MALSTTVRASISARQTSALDLGSAAASISAADEVSYADGAGAGQANRAWQDTRTLAASATEDLDLAGTLTDAFGATVTFARVKAIRIKAAPDNTNNVVVGAASSNAWASLLNATGTLTLRPGAFVELAVSEADATGYAVTAGTGDLLKVANSGAGSSVSYDIVIIGASA